MLDLGIVIVSYNTCDLLRNCLETVYASQGDLQFAVCVVDNNSDDGSADMVATEFPQALLCACDENLGYPAANNWGLKALGYPLRLGEEAPRFALLLNPDTEIPPDGLAKMLRFMEEHPEAGAAGPKLVRPDGTLDLACRRSFPTPAISFYRLTRLSSLFPHSRRFGRYNLTYLDPDEMTEVDSVVGAFMLIRREAIQQVGLMDESFFLYGEDLDWCFRIKAAGWKVYYVPAVTVLHIKRAATRHSPRAQIEFWRAMLLFYQKHYAHETGRLAHGMIVLALKARIGMERFRQRLGAGGKA